MILLRDGVALAAAAARSDPGIDWEKVLLTIAGAMAGAASAWLTFEITERRRTRMTQRALRQALVTELRQIELLLVSIVGKYAYLAPRIAAVPDFARELRWLLKEGPVQGRAMGLQMAERPPGAPEALDRLTDEQLVGLYVAQGRMEAVGTRLIAPVVDSVLSGRTAGFTSSQLPLLASVRWQLFLLELDAEWMRKFYDMTFTVDDPGNRAIVNENLDNRAQSYARRSMTTLGVVRIALIALDVSDPNRGVAPGEQPGPYRCPDCGRTSRVPFMRCGQHAEPGP